ncbi:hypothetical protein [Chitinophaga sp. ARDCPP14]|uniref:hypothetical protein n=1 Tax=Chitinophaga sp. ARDCPP14 TaxID=3391139 RepID=UPI003F522829
MPNIGQAYVGAYQDQNRQWLDEGLTAASVGKKVARLPLAPSAALQGLRSTLSPFSHSLSLRSGSSQSG